MHCSNCIALPKFTLAKQYSGNDRSTIALLNYQVKEAFHWKKLVQDEKLKEVSVSSVFKLMIMLLLWRY